MAALFDLRREDVMTTLEDFASLQPHVIFWNSECRELQWLHDQEDRRQAYDMYSRMSTALQTGHFTAVTTGQPIRMGSRTLFPMLTHSPGQDPNPVHLLLTGQGVCATPYYFLDEKMRNAVHAAVLAQ